MAAILQRQPLTIKQQVEELKNWHKQQQSKSSLKTSDKENSCSKNNGIKNSKHFINAPYNSNSISRTNFDEIPIKVTNSDFHSLVENNVAQVDSRPPCMPGKPEEKSNTPKFRFLKKGEGIARFNMGPLKVAKRTIPRKQDLSLKLTIVPSKSEAANKEKKAINEQNSENCDVVGNIPTLQVPDVKLNFKSWKSILSSENPEDVLEKVISNNQLELFDPNSSIDSSTASLMEKLLAIGKNKLSRDREELRVFEAIEQHMLDSSFCSTSSYVNRLMENAMISTPKKNTIPSLESQTLDVNSKDSDHIANKPVKNRKEGLSGGGVLTQIVSQPSSYFSLGENHEKLTKISSTEGKTETNNNNNCGERVPQLVPTWTKPETIENEDCDSTDEESSHYLEQSLHVKFSEQVDYKSFVEQSQSVDNTSQKEENRSAELYESQEWKEDSDDSSSCCSQCTKLDSSIEEMRPFSTKQNQSQPDQCYSQNEKKIPIERLNVGDLNTSNKFENNDPSSNNGLNNFPPLLVAKLKELEDEIKNFREENKTIKLYKESLEKERKQIQEEKRRLLLEKKKLQKEVEEEHKKVTAQLEEEKQKLAKEKLVFEKYSKSLTKNHSREDRKEIQALREQLSEMKEELNKKESRWGAAQARVRNQVKVLEEDNRKLKEEIENLRKQAKYWEIFNQKKKKPFNNTRLIHAISEHISNIVLDENSQEKNTESDGYFSQNSSGQKTKSITETDLKSMYGIRVIKENRNESTLSCSKNASKSTSISETLSSSKGCSDTGGLSVGGVKKSPCETDPPRIVADSPVSPTSSNNQREFQNQDRCEKPCLEDKSNCVIKEIVDENGNVEIVFPNGNIKKINKITGSEKFIYINGDVEEVTHDGTVKYYYSKSRIWQTTLPDGLEIVDFPDGKVEKRHVDGTIEIVYSNNNKKFSYPDGSKEIMYTDGTRLKIEADKTQILTLPNGQREIHKAEWKRREYPDGTMKTLFPDGTTETVYSNGRVRLKDKNGSLVMDSGSPPHP